MTLRLRLLFLLVGIVAAGLVLSDVVTYNALRSFLTTREDQQLDVAAFPVGRALLSSSGLGPQVPAAPPLGSTSGTSSTSGSSTSGTSGSSITGISGRTRSSSAFRNGGGFLVQPRGADRGVLVPPGTYGVLRSASGQVEAHLFFSYGGKAPSMPVIPARLPGSGDPARADRYLTVSSSGSEAQSYRAVAKPLAHGAGVIVVAVPLTDVDSTLRRLLLIELVVSALVLIGLGLLSWVMVRRDLRPLVQVTETAGAIAQGDLSQRVSYVAEGTEVGQLGKAFNTMVDEIEVAFAERAASEERLRRFLADASHELRTPLTSILGYAELFDLGVRDQPEALAASMRHIRSEASRMGTLVDDLFLLAQLDRQRPFQLEPVDLAELAEESAAAIRVSAPERTVIVAAPTPAVIVGDGPRLRQVIDNLLVNAVNHTPDDVIVEITVYEEGTSVVLAVHDEGPGIDPDEAQRIFEPFYRADPSRARSSGGAGLGLAIVRAIVDAHGGTVRTVPGAGATFEVRIPLGERSTPLTPLTELPEERSDR